jgi:hypothetical protein
MTADLAAALLNRAADGNQLLAILDTIADDVADDNIADFLNHAATLQEIQF